LLKNKVKEYRENLGMSQEELAQKSGVARTIISRIENNQASDVKLSTLLSLANALNEAVSTIFSL
jgi:DNA-binding XRE family transcriptional regulator